MRGAIISKDGISIVLTVSRLSSSIGTESRGIRFSSNTKFFEINLAVDSEINPFLFNRALRLTGFKAGVDTSKLNTDKNVTFSIAVDPDLHPQFRFKDEDYIGSVFESAITSSYVGRNQEYQGESIRTTTFDANSKDGCRLSCRLNEQRFAKFSIYDLSVIATGYSTGLINAPGLAATLKNQIEQDLGKGILDSVKDASVELSFVGPRDSMAKVKDRVIDIIRKNRAYFQGLLARIPRKHERHSWFHEKQTPELTYDEYDALDLVGEILAKGLPLPTEGDDPLLMSLIKKGYLAKSFFGKYSMNGKGNDVLQAQKRICLRN